MIMETGATTGVFPPTPRPAAGSPPRAARRTSARWPPTPGATYDEVERVDLSRLSRWSPCCRPRRRRPRHRAGRHGAGAGLCRVVGLQLREDLATVAAALRERQIWYPDSSP